MYILQIYVQICIIHAWLFIRGWSSLTFFGFTYIVHSIQLAQKGVGHDDLPTRKQHVCSDHGIWKHLVKLYIATSHDLTPNGGFCKGNLLFQGNQGWWNMCNLARNMFSKGTFGGIFRVHLGPNISITHAGGLIWYVLGVCFFFVVFCRVKDESLTAFDPCERWWILQPCHCYV